LVPRTIVPGPQSQGSSGVGFLRTDLGPVQETSPGPQSQDGPPGVRVSGKKAPGRLLKSKKRVWQRNVCFYTESLFLLLFYVCGT